MSLKTTKASLDVARRRNVHASAPIMRKGGVHGKSTKALRAAAKRQLHGQLGRGQLPRPEGRSLSLY